MAVYNSSGATFPTSSKKRKQRVTYRDEATVGDSFSSTTGFTQGYEIQVLEDGATFTEEKEIMEKAYRRPTMTPVGFFDGKRRGSFSIPRYAMPPRQRGDAPDDGKLIDSFGFSMYGWLSLDNVTGSSLYFQAGETITGGTSGATAVVVSYTPVTGSTGILLYTVPRGTMTYTFALNETVTGGTSTDTGDILASGGSKIKYELDETFTSLGFVNDVESYGEHINGAFVSSIDWSFDGTNACKQTIEGIFQKKAVSGVTTASGAEAAGQTVLSVTNPYMFEVGSLIQGVVDSGSDNRGYIVTAVSASTITVSPALNAGIANGAYVGPVFPKNNTWTPEGPVLSGNSGSVTLNGTVYRFLTGNVKVEVEYQTNVDDFGSDSYTGACAFTRKVTGSLTGFLTQAEVKEVLRSRYDADQSVACNIKMGTSVESSGAGLIEFDMPYVQLTPVGTPDFSGADCVQVTFEFQAFGSPTGNDELVIWQY